MPKRWIMGGIWVACLLYGERAAAQEANPTGKSIIRVAKIVFRGAKHIKEAELRNLVGISLNTPINPSLNRRGCEKIIARYEEMGRPFAQCVLVKGNDFSDTEVFYQITEGPKVTVRDIQFTGNTFVGSARLMTRLQSPEECACVSSTYNNQRIKNYITELSHFYRRFGYRDVRISPEVKRCDENGSTVALIFHIQEGKRYNSESENEPVAHFTCGYDGPKFVFGTAEESATHHEQIVGEKSTRIGQIRVVGNKRISTESILVHIPLVPGQIVSDDQLRQVEKKLAALNLFVADEAAGIHPTIVVIDSESGGQQKDLLINVKEKTIGKSSSAKARR